MIKKTLSVIALLGAASIAAAQQPTPSQTPARTPPPAPHTNLKVGDKAPDFPGEPYILLHSLSHALISEIALECGYPASSLKERIYALRKERDRGEFTRCGILIYTASAGAQGSLGNSFRDAAWGCVAQPCQPVSASRGRDSHCVDLSVRHPVRRGRHRTASRSPTP